MKAITLNVATRPFRNNRVVGSVLAGVVAALALATAANLYVFLNHGATYARLQEEEQKDRVRLASLDDEERRLSKEIQARNFRGVYERGRFANELILGRGFSWTLLFNTLEAVMPPDVMATSIRPSIKAEGSVVHLQGVAKNHGALIDLEDRLLKNQVFLRVYPANERKLNPSRPEITFTLNFDYMPLHAAPAVVAAGGSGPGAPATAQPTAPTPPATPAPSPKVAAAATIAPPGKASAPPTRPAIGTVGRDGRPRTPEVLARLVAAPGGVYVPPGAAPPKKVDHKAAAPKGKGSAAAARATTPAAGTAPPPRETNTAVPGRGAAMTSPAPGGAATTPATGAVAATPAQRLDESLNFTSRPVGEIYDALSRAHGVRFEYDAGVDRKEKVTAQLAGRRLDEAITLLARAARHRVSRRGDGLYHVVAVAGGEPIADRPIREETLGSSEVAP
ncbi:MAG TPA: PilN domain-containing protein [Candidatus Polarisedimenticolia bacterium]|nr:PilN domain-containing protein [Candidatus Polarisedimenticolia bacterium]